jgi:hypothetical protein
MAKKRPVWNKKTRIRGLVQRLAETEIDTIDRFRAHIAEGAGARRSAIKRSAVGLPKEVQEVLADDLAELDVISALGDELAIIALHRVVEKSTSLILRVRYGPASPDAAYIKRVCKFLKGHRIDIERTPHYRAVNELRLLNNTIKHGNDNKLVKSYPRWKKGQRKRLKRSSGLDAAYARLKKHVPGFIFAFAKRVKLQNGAGRA